MCALISAPASAAKLRVALLPSQLDQLNAECEPVLEALHANGRHW